MEAEAEEKRLESEAEKKCQEAEEAEAERKRLEADEAENQCTGANLSPMYEVVNNFLEGGQLTPVLDNDGNFDLALEEAQNTIMGPDEEQNNNVDVNEDEAQLPQKKQKRNKRQNQIVPCQSRATVCHICGCMPCEWEQYGLSVITIMMQAFDHEHRSPNGLLIDPNTNLPLENCSARRVAYKAFQYEKYGTITGNKSLPIPRCVLQQIKHLYP